MTDCDCPEGGGQMTVENKEMNRKNGMVVIREAMDKG